MKNNYPKLPKRLKDKLKLKWELKKRKLKKEKRIKLKREIGVLKEKLHIELKKPIKHTCISCEKQFDALYYQEIRCKYCGTTNITKGIDYTPVSKKLDQKIRLLNHIK